jgi:RNA-directed DNA polymerase
LPTTFDFLGFLHLLGKSRKGNATMRQRIAKDRLVRTLSVSNEKCRLMPPWPLTEQHRRLCRLLFKGGGLKMDSYLKFRYAPSVPI